MKFINKPRFFSLCLIFTLIFSLLISYAKSTSNDIADSVLRLHIVANSNSAEDQALKLAVRDRIVNDTKELFCLADSKNSATELARENLSLIQKIALDEIRSRGFDYSVCVSVENSAFPTRVYGDISLPKGTYTALKIKIGSGTGENWWCVMYPPLCFTDGILCASQNAMNELKATLSKDEYELITGSKEKAIPVEIRFKIVELFQSIF